MSNKEETEEMSVPDCDERPTRRKKTKKKHLVNLTPVNKIIVEYNDYGIPVGEGATELKSYIGVVVRDNVSIFYDNWRHVPLEIEEKLWDHILSKFVLDMRSKKYVLQSMGTSLRNFRSALNTNFIQPNKDHRNQLKLPPKEYPIITKSKWKEFVDKMLGAKFQEQSQKRKQLRAKIKYNHRLGSSGYSGLLYRKKSEFGVSVKEIDCSQL